MTHPEELLAGYVDGTLSQTERAVVDAHLPGCAVCREEVELARQAVTALATLVEEPVPFGVMGPVLAEAGRRFERHHAVTWQRFQWAAGVAAAAALVLVVALNLGGTGGDGDDLRAEADDGGTAESAPGETAAILAEEVQLESQPGVNYDDAGVQALASQEVARSSEELAPDTGEAGSADFESPRRARTCLRTSGAPLDDPRDVLVRLIAAEYQETPAYFAIFEESPGADQAADAVVVWIASIDGCTLLSAASQSL